MILGPDEAHLNESVKILNAWILFTIVCSDL